jgi:bifunctional DNA-binding transcriptional regulator/antitoxin component of YhaV-PrlF toxin-antitoxin module
MFIANQGLSMLVVKITVKAIRVGNSVRVAIPSEVLKVARVKEGDSLLIDYDEKTGRITLEKVSG